MVLVFPWPEVPGHTLGLGSFGAEMRSGQDLQAELSRCLGRAVVLEGGRGQNGQKGGREEEKAWPLLGQQRSVRDKAVPAEAVLVLGAHTVWAPFLGHICPGERVKTGFGGHQH